MIGVVSATVGYLYYIQFSPSMGNIWWRNRKLSPLGAYKLMVHPLHNTLFWVNPSLWKINYYLWLAGGLLADKYLL